MFKNIKNNVILTIALKYLEKQGNQIAKYLVEEKGYPKDIKDVRKDIKEAIVHMLLKGG